MSNKKSFNDFSLEELFFIKEELKKVDSKEEFECLLDDAILSLTNDTSLNSRLTLDIMFELNMLPFDIMKILVQNNISNFEELKLVQINTLKGIDAISEEYLEWAQRFFDMSSIDDSKKRK